MISYLRGTVQVQSDGGIVLDVAGVGYGVRVASDTHGSLRDGAEATLQIYEHIKEDAHDLYGFLNQQSKSFFELLLSVNGVGAKMALSIMNVASEPQLREAIAGGDTKTIQAASGVGKRLAERVIVDLKDKVGLVSSDSATDFLGAAPTTDEAVQALGALGYSPQDASAALQGIDASLPLEDRIKLALKARQG